MIKKGTFMKFPYLIQILIFIVCLNRSVYAASFLEEFIKPENIPSFQEEMDQSLQDFLKFVENNKLETMSSKSRKAMIYDWLIRSELKASTPIQEDWNTKLIPLLENFVTNSKNSATVSVSIQNKPKSTTFAWHTLTPKFLFRRLLTQGKFNTADSKESFIHFRTKNYNDEEGTTRRIYINTNGNPDILEATLTSLQGLLRNSNLKQKGLLFKVGNLKNGVRADSIVIYVKNNDFISVHNELSKNIKNLNLPHTPKLPPRMTFLSDPKLPISVATEKPSNFFYQSYSDIVSNSLNKALESTGDKNFNDFKQAFFASMAKEGYLNGFPMFLKDDCSARS